MQLKLPKTDKGKSWTLRIVRKNPIVGGEEAWGFCDSIKREIVVSRETEKHGLSREILLHELLHQLMPFLSEEAVIHVSQALDAALDIAESRDILDL